MKVLGIWVAGFLFGYLACCSLPYDGPFLGGLGCAGLVSIFGAFRLAGCRALLPILAAPLFSLLAAALLWPLGFLPWKLVGALQPALVSMFFLQVIFLTVPGRLPLFTLLGQIALGIGVTDWAFTLWYPDCTGGQRIAGCLVTVAYTVFLSLLVAGLKRRERRQKAPPPPEPPSGRGLTELAKRLEYSPLRALALEVVRPCALAYREGAHEGLFDAIAHHLTVKTHPTVHAFLAALHAEMLDLKRGGDCGRAAIARQRATYEMLQVLELP